MRPCFILFGSIPIPFKNLFRSEHCLKGFRFKRQAHPNKKTAEKGLARRAFVLAFQNNRILFLVCGKSGPINYPDWVAARGMG